MESGQGESTKVDMNPPIWMDRRFMRVLVITAVVLPLCAGTEVFVISPSFEGLSWIRVTPSTNGWPVDSMIFSDPNEFEIGVITRHGLFFYDRDSCDVSGPLIVDNSSWYKGAFDAESVWGNVYLTTGSQNHSTFVYEKDYQTEEWEFNPFVVRNISGEAKFEHIEYYYSHPYTYFFLGSPTIGLVKCTYATRSGELITTTNGLPSNSVKCMQVVGNTLLVGTGSGFALFDLQTGTNFSCTEDDNQETFSVIDIEYVPLSNKIYVGTEEGLLIFRENGTSATPIGLRKTEVDGLPHKRVNALEIDHNRKRLYIGTPRGLSYIDLDTEEDSITLVISSDDFTLDGISQVVECILIPENIGRDYLYLGTYSGYLVEVPASFTPATLSTLAMTRLFVYGSGVGFLAALWIWYTRASHSTRFADARNRSLRDLVRLGESQHVEFKSSMRWSYRKSRVDRELEKEIAKAVAGFMNAEGGVLLIGVEDSGSIRGLELDYKNVQNKNDDGFERHFTGLLNAFIGAGFRYLVNTSVIEVEGNKVFRADVRPANEPVYLSDGKGSIFVVRQGGRSQTLDSQETVRYVKQRWPKL